MRLILRICFCIAVLFGVTTCRAQMYTFTDLGTLGGANSRAWAINSSGQVVGVSDTIVPNVVHAFRTAPNSPINPLTDDLGTLGGLNSEAKAINDAGQVVGTSAPTDYSAPSFIVHAFRTAPNSPINPLTDDLNADVARSWGFGINASGQVVGFVHATPYTPDLAFRTAPNRAINSLSDILGTLGGEYSVANGVNAAGQVVGYASTAENMAVHAFLHSGGAMSDLGTLGGSTSQALAINNFGQVVGLASPTGDMMVHAFLHSGGAMSDLGTLGSNSIATAINDYGQVVGYSRTNGNIDHAFLHNNGAIFDLNDLVLAGSGGEGALSWATAINNAGQIVGFMCCSPQNAFEHRAFLLNPIYRASVQQPISADGSSEFSSTRRVVPVRFKLTKYAQPTCSLMPATIAITRVTSETLAPIGENTYATPAESGSNFRIDTNCEYVYNVAASSLGAGVYRVDISINGIMVGHAVFALR